MLKENELETLRNELRYDPESGKIFWKISARNGTKIAGREAGTSSDSYGYKVVKVNGKMYKVHRLAFILMGEEWPEIVDHINHIRNDNRWVNLRSVTSSENSCNRLISSRNTTGHSGIYWDKVGKKYYVLFQRKYLGRHKTLEQALAAKEAYND